MNLRSDPSTLVVKRPGPFAGARRGRRSRPSQAGDPGLQPWKAPGDGDSRVLEHTHRGGEHGIPPEPPPQNGCDSPDPVPFTRRCSAHAARNRKDPGSLPPPRQRAIVHAVLAAKAATPPRGGRGEGRQTAWLLGVISRPSRAAPASAGRTRASSKRPGKGERGGEPPGARVKRDITGGSARRATDGQRTRTGATAPRGGGFSARGRARASNMRCRDR
jgi:hypothetical protein